MKLRPGKHSGWHAAALALLVGCDNRGAPSPTADTAAAGQGAGGAGGGAATASSVGAAPVGAPATATAAASAGVAMLVPTPAASACDSPDSCARVARVIEASEAAREALKKMNKEDGKGCLADLDRAARADAKTEAQFAMIRGQCEMLVGQCQAGKKRVEGHFQETTNQPPEQRVKSAEAMASMWCRGGDMTSRDRLLQALYELQQGAYITRKEASYCTARHEAVKKLAQEVKPRDSDDSQVKSAPDAVFHMTAACLGRAGDCAGAWKVFQETPVLARELSKKDGGEQERKKSIRQSFESSVPACAGKP